MRQSDYQRLRIQVLRERGVPPPALRCERHARFSEQAWEDFKNSLGPPGKWESFNQAGQSLRGGMIGRTSIVRFASKTIRAWTYEMPDGKLEQFQVAVGN